MATDRFPRGRPSIRLRGDENAPAAVDFDGSGRVDLRHSVPDVLASTANLLKVNGWQAGAAFTQGTQNFEVMREWNRSEVYRRTLVYFAQQLSQ